MPTIEERLTLAEQRIIGLRQMVMTFDTEFRAFRRSLEAEKADSVRREAREAQAEENRKRKERRRNER